MHQVAAISAYLAPGLRFFHQGQFDGRRIRTNRCRSCTCECCKCFATT